MTLTPRFPDLVGMYVTQAYSGHEQEVARQRVLKWATGEEKWSVETIAALSGKYWSTEVFAVLAHIDRTVPEREIAADTVERLRDNPFLLGWREGATVRLVPGADTSRWYEHKRKDLDPGP